MIRALQIGPWLAAALLAGSLGARAAPNESVLRVPVADGAGRALIDVTVFRPDGPGPFPIVVLSHGSPRSAAKRRAHGRTRLAAQSEPFLAMGFAVVVPTRRGYGDSGGKWAEGYGGCDNPDYYDAGLESARDMRAAVDAVRHEPWADAGRVVLVGQSAGGFGSVAASSTPFAGLVAVVNFAGGRGSVAPGRVCHASRLVEAMRRYGRGARVPELWIYSANDRYFDPDLARRMHEAFVAAGGRAELVEAPESGVDGHGYFLRAMDDWAPRVAAFLHRTGVAP
ncbi:MAG TPA: alpha/beta fold hydrolase [Usitatibacter sp.]|nr:alpha/beta fold hydrolase [Usitatibacter sp.]